MRRLWLRIWLAVLASTVLVVVLSFAILRTLFDPGQLIVSIESLAGEVAAALPPVASSPVELRRVLRDWRRRSDADLALFDEQRRPVAQVGRPLPPPRVEIDESHWLGRRGPPRHADGFERPLRGAMLRGAPFFAHRLADGRWLVVGRDLGARRPFGAIAWLSLLALGMALGAYPIVRRLTRRLERLQQGVDALGAGQLSARVAVEGRDEVAQLAKSFNRAAASIEALVQTHRSLLANASHELRSPLARVRLAIEMMGDERLPASSRARLKDELERDIAELDALIDEILLASRLEAQAAAQQPSAREPVDLTALVAEEAARVDAEVHGAPVTVLGDARLLRRLVRNLLENARRHGGAAPIDVELAVNGAQAIVAVRDRGPGVAEAERSRIFEPFYRARGLSEAGGGVGLGLALVARIAQLHDGSVECRAREGGGAEFIVRLGLA